MSAGNALAQVRGLYAGLTNDAVLLAARLLDAVEQARDLLAPIAEEVTPAGLAAGAVHQILADAAADAVPPAAERPASALVSRNGYALLYADAMARGRGLDLDGSPRRECRPLKP